MEGTAGRGAAVSVFVLDCSVAAAWLFEDEATPETDALLDQLADGAALVPLHWRLELGNMLVQAERRRRIAPAQAAASVEFVDSLPIEVDAETDRRSFREVLALARSASLTTYDAAYLELERIGSGHSRQGACSSGSRLEGGDVALIGRPSSRA